MPKPGQARAGSLAGRIRLWMLDHPGAHSLTAIADGIPPDPGATRKQWTTRVGKECGRLHARGLLDRHRDPDAPARGPGSTYSLTAAHPKETTAP